MQKKEDKKKLDPWDEANMLDNQKNEGVHVTTVANQRYVYRECPVFLPRLRCVAHISGIDRTQPVEEIVDMHCHYHWVWPIPCRIRSMSALFIYCSRASDRMDWDQQG